jgi:rhamnulokinase
MLGVLDEGKLTMQEIARCTTKIKREGGHIYWDAEALFQFVRDTLKIVLKKEQVPRLDGVGVDSWGVDYALLDAQGKLLHLPFNYRDPRNNGMLAKAFKVIPKEKLFVITGLQMMQINSLFQLYAELLEFPQNLRKAKSFLHIADLIQYYLTGIIKCEYSNASTSQLLDVKNRTWSREILQAFGLPQEIFPEIILPGTHLGDVKKHLLPRNYPTSIPVIVPAGHDTGSAIAAVPASGGEDWAYISSGTWSLVGIESKVPLTQPEVLEHRFTNEGGVAGTYRVLKNVQALWILQSCKDQWFAENPALNHDIIEAMAQNAPAFKHLVFPDHRSFVMPENMIVAIQKYCEASGQQIPREIGSIARGVLESLAFRYREMIESLEKISGRKLSRIHIVGGGSRDTQLCQFAANACNRVVLAGPAEATAIGNILVQAWGAGAITSLEQLRGIVRQSFPVVEYRPQNVPKWDEGYVTYKKYTTHRESYAD